MECPKCGTKCNIKTKYCSECEHALSSANSENGIVTKIPTKISSTNNTPPSIPPFEPPASEFPNDIFSDFDDDDDIPSMLSRGSSNKNRNSVFDDVFEESDSSIFDNADDEKKSISKKSVISSAHSIDSIFDDIPTNVYDWNEEDEEDRLDMQQSKLKRHKQTKAVRRNKGDLIFWLITLGLVALAAVMFMFFLSKNYEGRLSLFFNSVFGNSLITGDAIAYEGETPNGELAIIIKVFAREGSLVRFVNGDDVLQEATVTGTSVTFYASKSIWIPNEAVSGSEITIVPTLYVIDPAQPDKLVPVEIAPLVITLPSVTLRLEEPVTRELITNSDQVKISGYVNDNTVSVFVGDVQFAVDQNGYFMGYYFAESLGTHEVFIEAKKPGHEVVKEKLTIIYTTSDFSLKINNESLLTFDDTITITGTMDRGATLKILNIDTSNEVIDSANGTFSFTALLPLEGLYTPILELSAGGSTSQVMLYIEHAPDKDRYIEKAISLDRDYDHAYSTSTLDRNYYMKGKIVEVYKTYPYTVAKMKTEGDHFVILSYYHTTASIEANDGKTYRIYGDITGVNSDELLEIYCWFVYKS